MRMYKLILPFLIIIMILGLINSSCVLCAANKEEEMNEEVILNKLYHVTQGLTEQQRPDGSWPLVTQDKRFSIVATGLFGLGTLSLPTPDIIKAVTFILSQQARRGSLEGYFFFPLE